MLFNSLTFYHAARIIFFIPSDYLIAHLLISLLKVETLFLGMRIYPY